MAQYGAESATFGGVVFKRAKIWGGCFGYWKIQNGPRVFHIDPLHGLIWPRCKGQFSPKFWYQNSPISVGLNWPQKQYHSGLIRFGPIFGAKLALFILQCVHFPKLFLFFFFSFLPFCSTQVDDQIGTWHDPERVRAHFGQSNFLFFQQKRKKEILLILLIFAYFKVQKKKRKKENGQENRSFFSFF